MIEERPYRVGYDFNCPFCPRMLHRAGMLDHLWVLVLSTLMLHSNSFSKSAHPNGISLDRPTEAQLRKPRVVPDDQFMQRLALFIQGH